MFCFVSDIIFYCRTHWNQPSYLRLDPNSASYDDKNIQRPVWKAVRKRNRPSDLTRVLLLDQITSFLFLCKKNQCTFWCDRERKEAVYKQRQPVARQTVGKKGLGTLDICSSVSSDLMFTFQHIKRSFSCSSLYRNRTGRFYWHSV